MSVLSQFLSGGGGKLRYQDFTASGTFTPSTQLLANGGQVMVFLVGGGGGGGGGQSNTSNGRGGGGGGGQVKFVPFTVSAATTVTIGAGGTGGTYPGTPSGTGGTTSFGALTAVGGGGGSNQIGSSTSSQTFIGPGGTSTGESGIIYQGGNGVSNATPDLYTGRGASTNGSPITAAGISGYGCGSDNSSTTGVANTGAGARGGSGVSGQTGSSGFCRVYWWE